MNRFPQADAITGLTPGPIVEETVKLAMMIGLRIQGVLRFSLSQIGAMSGADADLLLGAKTGLRSTGEWLETLCRDSVPFSVDWLLWVSMIRTREWTVVSSELLKQSKHVQAMCNEFKEHQQKIWSAKSKSGS